MNGYGFEGDLILEKLAEVGKVEDFYEAIDSDDFEKIIYLLKSINISAETIKLVLAEIKKEC